MQEEQKTEQTEEMNLEPEETETPADESPAEETPAEEVPAEEAPKAEKSKKEKGAKVKKADLDKALQERDEYMNALIRERADFDNFRKRNKLAVSEAYSNGMADAALKLIPMIDNLERAAQAECADEAYKAGVELVLKQCFTCLGEMNIHQIEADGKLFDPNFHNAVMQVPAEEGEESGIVKNVLMKGYQMGDKVIRHAMVQVTE